MFRRIGFWLAYLALLLAAIFWIASAKAAPGGTYFTLDTGLTAFKWGVNQSGLGFPHFESPKWDIEPGIEWATDGMATRGLWIRLSFPWQALGRSATFYHQGQTYIDGPRLGIRWRGRLVP